MSVEHDSPEGIALRFSGRPAPIRDLYDYEHRVSGLVSLIYECPLPFVVSVSGEWGRGKSTFIEMVVNAVDRTKVSNIVWYHPWRYNILDFEDAWESMAEILSAEIESEEPQGTGERSLVQSIARNRWVRLALRTGATLVPVVGSTLRKGVEDAEKAIDEHYRKRQDLSRHYSLFEDVRNRLWDLSNGKRILLIIDDLDRCDPPVVAHILRCLPTLFAPLKDGPGFVLLLGMDRKATIDALCRFNGWNESHNLDYLDKIIQINVTLPILQIGTGDTDTVWEKIERAVNGGKSRGIPKDRIVVIARFMHFNPRELERFCLLFDLKWKSRYEANLKAKKVATPKFNLEEWREAFRDRLIWESIVELRWPLYDAKSGDVKANKKAIEQALKGDLNVGPDLPCSSFVNDPSFLEIHRIYFRNEWPALPSRRPSCR